MLNMRQLNKAIDSMKKHNNNLLERVKKEVFTPSAFVNYLDSNWNTASTKNDTVKKFDQLIPDSIKTIVNQRTQGRIASSVSSNESILWDYNAEEKELRRHKMEWHRKISLSLACLVLFMVGAPLGSIIRKGGLGNSLISAIIFFMLFYFISNTGEKFAKEGEWSAFMGMWLSTFVLVPVGIFLTYKALHDSQLFNREYYFRLWRQFQAFRKRKKG